MKVVKVFVQPHNVDTFQNIAHWVGTLHLSRSESKKISNAIE